MKKILSNAICTFFGVLIGLILIIPIIGEPLFPLEVLPFLILGLMIISIICGILKYFFID